MFKTVLVHLRGIAGDTATLKAALQVARPFGAHLECVHVRPDLAALISRATAADMGDEDTDTITEMLHRLQDESAERAQRAADAFADFRAKENLAAAGAPPGPGKTNGAFRESTGNELDRLVAESRYHDLLVVKAADEQAGSLPVNELGQLIVSSGRPVLLAPSVPARPIRTVVIAWKDVPEAARAVGAAMPLLAKAEKIFVATASEEDEPGSDCDGVVRQLGWHGLSAEAHRVVPGDRDAPHAVLEMARAASADLLVMGAYGHNRLAEVILGGFTQNVLEDASLPVLMLH